MATATREATAAQVTDSPVMSLQNLTREFDTRGGRITAVDSVNIDLHQGDILCLVGESGSGKTTVARMAAGMLKPTRGNVLYKGKDIYEMSKKEFKAYRKDVQIIHQDPYASLNPVQTIGDMLRAPLLKHKIVKNRAEATRRAGELLELVDCSPIENFIDKYPHQLSGGQRQRISIARALTMDPEVLIADEPTSALDVSVQAAVLDMFAELQSRYEFACLFVSHDLAVVDMLAHRVLVLKDGRQVEQGPTAEVLHHPAADYTRRLLAAAPVPDPDEQYAKRTERRLLLESLGETPY